MKDRRMSSGAATQFENFEAAFRGGVNGCRRTCACGVEYYDTHNTGYDWEEGEYEALEADPKAIGLPYAVGVVEFEGRVFVDGCTCWHERAKRIIAFIVGHDTAIVQFLKRERARKQAEADRSPVLEGA